MLRIFIDSTGHVRPESTVVAQSSGNQRSTRRRSLVSAICDSAQLNGTARRSPYPCSFPFTSGIRRRRQCRGTACCTAASTAAHTRASRRGCAASTPTAQGGNMARRGTGRRSARNGSRSTATKRGTRPVTPRPPEAADSGKSTTAAAAMKIEDHPRHRRPYESVLETIGWTPLIRLHHVTRGIRTPVYGKAEFFNPGGSVKDRIGAPDHRARRARGASAARRHHCRGHERQHGSRTRDRRRRSKATSASSQCPTRCRRRKFGSSRRLARRSS